MTREQAINYLISSGFSEEQVSEVVRALTYEPTTKNDLGVDCISRSGAIKAIEDKAKKLTNEDTINGLCGAVAILFDMPSVTPQLSVPEVTALAEWTTKLTEANKSAYSQGYADGMKAQAEQKTGHWEYGYAFPDGQYCRCSECEELIKCIYPMHYCPNCGADMREVEE